MRVSQRTIRMRTHPENTIKLYNLLVKQGDSDSTSSKGGSVSQRTIKMRTRADGKAKGIAIRRK